MSQYRRIQLQWLMRGFALKLQLQKRGKNTTWKGLRGDSIYKKSSIKVVWLLLEKHRRSDSFTIQSISYSWDTVIAKDFPKMRELYFSLSKMWNGILLTFQIVYGLSESIEKGLLVGRLVVSRSQKKKSHQGMPFVFTYISHTRLNGKRSSIVGIQEMLRGCWESMSKLNVTEKWLWCAWNRI